MIRIDCPSCDYPIFSTTLPDPPIVGCPNCGAQIEVPHGR